MHTNIDEGTKRGNVGHHAFQNHARLQITQLLHTVLKSRSFEFRARIAAGFFQLFQNIRHGRHTEALIGILLRVESLQ